MYVSNFRLEENFRWVSVYSKYSKIGAGSEFSVGTCYNKEETAMDKE